MTGRKPPRIVLQERDRRLLQVLGSMRVVDRDQARRLAPFGSVTRANTRLLALVSAGLLARLTVGTTHGGHRHLYARTRAGAAAVGGEYRPAPWNAQSPIVAGQPLLEHQLRLNDLYLAVHALSDPDVLHVRGWRTFLHPPVPTIPLIPDAYLEIHQRERVRALFVEMDLATEPLRTWTRKAERYVALARSGDVASAFGHEQFGVLVVVPSERRLQTVRRTIAATTTKLFWLTTFASVRPDAIWTNVWWRPTGERPLSILK